jgi:hypothetical protein
VAAGVILSLAGCGNAQKTTAQTAITAAETALGAVRGEAEKIVPDQVKAVEDALNVAKDQFQKGQFKEALASAQDLAAKAGALADSASARKAMLTQSWDALSQGMPGVMDAIKSRVDILAKAKKLPAGLDAQKLEGVKSELTAMTQTWGEASSAFASGSMADALAKAGDVKQKAVDAMNTLNMQVPDALK